MMATPPENQQPNERSKYSLKKNSVNRAATSLALDAIAKYPQLRNGAPYFIADQLLKHLTDNQELDLVKASEAQIEENVAWKLTEKIHSAFGIGKRRSDSKRKYPPTNGKKIWPWRS